jgi:hypothetical protein
MSKGAPCCLVNLTQVILKTDVFLFAIYYRFPHRPRGVGIRRLASRDERKAAQAITSTKTMKQTIYKSSAIYCNLDLSLYGSWCLSGLEGTKSD